MLTLIGAPWGSAISLLVKGGAKHRAQGGCAPPFWAPKHSGVGHLGVCDLAVVSQLLPSRASFRSLGLTSVFSVFVTPCGLLGTSKAWHWRPISYCFTPLRSFYVSDNLAVAKEYHNGSDAEHLSQARWNTKEKMPIPVSKWCWLGCAQEKNKGDRNRALHPNPNYWYNKCFTDG